MANVNKVILIGRLGQNPELKSTPSGKAVCNFTVATAFKPSRGGEEVTTWHRVVAWEKQAEAIKEYMKKGSQIYIEGRIDNRSYDKDGTKQYISEVIVTLFQFLDRKPDNKPAEDSKPAKDDDLPF